MTPLLHLARAAALVLALACLPAAQAAATEALAIMPAGDVNGPSQAWQRPDGEVRVYYRDGAKRSVYVATRDGTQLAAQPAEPALAAINLHGAVFHTDRRGIEHVFYLQKRCEPECTAPTKDFFIDVLWMSRKPGSDWGQPSVVFQGYVGALRQVAETKSGRLVLAFAEWQQGAQPRPPTGAHQIRFLLSDDGQSWRIGSAALTASVPRAPNAPGFGAVEPSVVALPNGKLWLVVRTQTQSLWESTSVDGERWEPLRPSLFPSPSAPAYVVTTKAGGTVLLWNDAFQPSRVDGRFVYGGRDVLHGAFSKDAGHTWSGFREIYTDPMILQPAVTGDFGTGYPTAAELSDGRILVLTGQGDGRMAWIVFRPAFLDETTASAAGLTTAGRPGLIAFAQADGVANRKRMRNPVAKAGTKPGEVVLDLAAMSNAGAALWNFPAASAGTLSLTLEGTSASGLLKFHLLDRFLVPGDKSLPELSLVSVDWPIMPGQTRIDLRWDRGGMTISMPGQPPRTVTRPVSGLPNYLYIESAGTGSLAVRSLTMTGGSR